MPLKLTNLHISVEKKPIVLGVSLTIKPGEVHAIMGPNGSGKSTLANAIMGHPKYTITEGKIVVDKKDITNISPDKKFHAGLFLSMQYPPEIPGVTVANFLRQATNNHPAPLLRKEGANSDAGAAGAPSLRRRGLGGGQSRLPGSIKHAAQNPLEFHKQLLAKMKELKMDPDFAKRYLNTGFSGGEKKRAEILQLLMLNPKYAILDETDSGLDVDALKTVAEGINKFHTKNTGILLITHYNRILEYIIPDFVHIMYQGKIVKSGGKELALEIEKKGYAGITKSE